MHFLHLTLLYCMLIVISSDPALAPSPAPTKIVGSAATNIIFQSKDGGQTWQDISQSLPDNEQPEGFFAGESDLYLLINNEMYRSPSNLNTPVWEKETGLDPRSNSIVFNRSGVMAYNYEGQVYQKMSPAGWMPVYTTFKKQTLRIVFETSDGAVFLGRENGLYKSGDRGQSWKQVQNGGWVMDIVEADGVLIATGQGGIMRSTDNGEHWESVINEGGVGIAVERIDGGFAAISYNTTLKARRIHISLDRGKTWQAIDAGLLPSASISSIKQIGKYLICGHPDGIFRSADMGKTWSIVHSSVDNAFKLTVNRNTAPFGDNRKVFKLYVSGYVVYAVARDSGC
jgi:photosystem II stability/assembly factor-like uncharacterized protein